MKFSDEHLASVSKSAMPVVAASASDVEDGVAPSGGRIKRLTLRSPSR